MIDIEIKYKRYFYVMQQIKKFFLSLILVFNYNNPLVNVFTLIVIQLIVIIYLFIYRPFIYWILNLIEIIIEVILYK